MWPYLERADDVLANSSSFMMLVFFVVSLIFKAAAMAELPDVQRVLSVEQQRDFAVPIGSLQFVMLACCVVIASTGFGCGDAGMLL